MWNLVSYFKEITQAQDIRERSAEKDTWAWKEVRHKLQNDDIHDVHSSPNTYQKGDQMQVHETFEACCAYEKEEEWM